MTEDQLNALMNWVDAKMKSIIDSDCISASLCERELREKLKNIMVSESTYIGDTQWMQVPEPLTPKLISLGNNCHEYFIKGVKFAEKMHGIGGK